jgi:hypothetical protein
MRSQWPWMVIQPVPGAGGQRGDSQAGFDAGREPAACVRRNDDRDDGSTAGGWHRRLQSRSTDDADGWSCAFAWWPRRRRPELTPGRKHPAPFYLWPPLMIWSYVCVAGAPTSMCTVVKSPSRVAIAKLKSATRFIAETPPVNRYEAAVNSSQSYFQAQGLAVAALARHLGF